MSNWNKSSFCEQGACVEVQFAKSSKCDSGICVEVHLGQDVAIRNNKAPADVIWFDADEWRAFIAGVKAGEFDI